MTAAAAPSSSVRPFSPLRFALRELRSGARGFRILISCIALGVTAIAGVGSLSQSLTEGLSREGRNILGGDLAFSLVHREATPAERDFLSARGTVSASATLRAMARTPERKQTLIELKAVDGGYPLYGTVTLNPAQPLNEALAKRGGGYGIAVDPILLQRLNVKRGDRITVGSASFIITGTLVSEPDKLATGIALGPRVLMSEEALRATDLLAPGSLVRWSYRLRVSDGSDAAAADVITAAEKEQPNAGWQIRGRNNATPALERNVERFTQFLTLVGLAALLIGGVGVANAVRSHVDRKRAVIATLKAVGASGGRVFAIYLWQVMLLAFGGALIGVICGATLPYIVVGLFGSLLPLPLAPAVHPIELGLAMLYGLMAALAFALWPLGRAHDVPVSALFRDAVAPTTVRPRRRYWIATVVAVAAVAAITVLLSYDRKIALIFIAAAAAMFVVLQGVARLLMAAARRLPRPRSTALRLAIANIHRPGALTPAVVLSLGLGLALLVTVVEIDGNLKREFEGALPDKAPSFYFMDIQSADAERFDKLIAATAPGATLDRVPMLRGRIMSVKGVDADEIKAPPEVSWVLESDRGITFATDVPKGSTVSAGEWWRADDRGPPQVSMENKIAEGLGLKVGDPIVVNVLGRNIEARVANLRNVDWETLGINFVLVFSPNTFAGAPHTDIATLAYQGGGTTEQEIAVLDAVAEAFPAVTAVRVKDAVEVIGVLVRNLVLGIRGASVVALISAMLVLGGALAAGHSERVYDAVVLKTLGATRAKLMGAYALEYLLLGSATALFGVVAGSIAAWQVVTRVMHLSFAWLPAPALAAAFGALVVTVALGLLGTLTALSHKPVKVLRNL